MSVCIVAKYPWGAIKKLVPGATPGAIICTDTRASTGQGQVLDGLIVKQGMPNQASVVCFTSSQADVTRHAFKAIHGASTLKAVGRELRTAHDQYGGATQVLAAVWKPPAGLPRITELMPQQYEPKRVDANIVGIGHGPTLEWFRENFVEDPRPNLPKPIPPEALQAWERQFGPTTFPPPCMRYQIGEAALAVAATLAEAIERVGDLTVGLPIQLTTVQAGEVTRLSVTQSADLKHFSDLTPTGEESVLPLGPARRTDRDRQEYRSVVLLR